MSNWRWAQNSPQEEIAYWRSVRRYGTFILVLILIVIFSLAGFSPGVVLTTAVSIASGVATFRLLIDRNPRVRDIARLGVTRRMYLIIWSLAFAAIIIIQAILAARVGAWLAGAVSPLAIAVEWLIARELCGARPNGGS